MKSENPSFYDLPEELQRMLQISREQIKEGKVISAEELRKELRDI